MPLIPMRICEKHVTNPIKLLTIFLKLFYNHFDNFVTIFAALELSLLLSPEEGCR